MVQDVDLVTHEAQQLEGAVAVVACMGMLSVGDMASAGDVGRSSDGVGAMRGSVHRSPRMRHKGMERESVQASQSTSRRRDESPTKSEMA